MIDFAGLMRPLLGVCWTRSFKWNLPERRCLGRLFTFWPIMLLLVLQANSEAIAQSSKVEFDIAPQSLQSALEHFSDLTDMQMSYSAELVQGLRSPGISGRFEPLRALGKLLEGSGLTPRLTKNRTVTLSRVDANRLSADQLIAMHPMEDFMYAAAEPDELTENGPIEQEDLMVRGAPLSGYHVLNATTGTKTDTPILEIPMSVQVVPRAVLDDQQAIRIEDALKNVSGVVKGFGFGNLEDTFVIRGFENSTTTFGLTQVYRDGSLAVGGLFSTTDVERIEVLKGPAAMLYGRLEPGGLINVITRRPQEEAAYSLQQQFGSYDTYRTTLGATGSLTNDGSLTYRLDFEYLDKNTFRDFTFNQQTFVSPKLTWKISDQTQVDFDYQYFNQETIIDWGIPPIGNRPANIPFKTFLGEPTDRFPYKTNSGSIRLSHAFNENWLLQAKYYKFSNQYDNSGSAGANSPVSLDEETGELSRRFLRENHDFNSDFLTMNLNGKFSTWNIEHNLLLGGDWFDSSFIENGTSLLTVGDGGPLPINIFNPVYGRGIVYNPSLPNNYFAKIDENWFGFYIQDQLALTESWHLLTGLRFDHAEAKSSSRADLSGVRAIANAFSPRVGLLYQPLSWLSLYGSYIQGFNGSVGGRTLDGSALAPNRSRQYEAGIKAEWLEGNLTSTLVFYHLTKENLRTPVPNVSLAQQGIVNQTGEARSQGIELDVSGKLADDWNIIGSYAYTDTRITKDRDQNGGPGNEGHRLHNAPLHSGSLWLYHAFGEFAIPELSAGFGGFFVGQRQGDLENSFQLPGYVRLDASIKYRQPIGLSNLTLQFNVQNLLDKRYFASTRPARVGSTPGDPITFIGSIKLDL